MSENGGQSGGGGATQHGSAIWVRRHDWLLGAWTRPIFAARPCRVNENALLPPSPPGFAGGEGRGRGVGPAACRIPLTLPSPPQTHGRGCTEIRISMSLSFLL